MGRDIFHS